MKLERHVNSTMLMLMLFVAGVGLFFRTNRSDPALYEQCNRPSIKEYRLNCDGKGQKREYVNLLLGRSMNVNRCSIDELRLIPGISSRVAKNIVKWRNEKGIFSSYDQLSLVERVGPKTLEKLMNQVNFGMTEIN